jgi:uncharacterized membrane protein
MHAEELKEQGRNDDRVVSTDNRIWEIDLLRTVAIVLMVVFHLVYDLNEFAGLDVNYWSGFWYWEGRASAWTFIFLSGISSGFSRNTVKRGVKVFAAGMLITLVTYFFLREQYIRFGILHFLGTCMVLFPLLKRMSNTGLVIGAVAIALLGIPVQRVVADTALLLPLGIMYNGFVSADYYPLIPYLSIFMMGVLAYKLHYFKRVSLFKFSFQNRYITMISKNSLMIYLIHQPIVLGIVLLIQWIAG